MTLPEALSSSSLVACLLFALGGQAQAQSKYELKLGTATAKLGDAASVISHLFLTGTWQFHPPCIDACDANEDGRVDLADSAYILRYLFRFGPEPKDPFPEFGPDPSYDNLDCVGGAICQ